MKRILFALAAAMAAVCVLPMDAQAAPGGLDTLAPAGLGLPSLAADKPITVSAIAEFARVTRGQSFHVAARVHVKKDWVFYSPNPGKAGGFEPIAGGLAVRAGRVGADEKTLGTNLQNPLTVGAVLWPPDKPHDTVVAGEKSVNNGYVGNMTVYATVAVPADAPTGRYMVEVDLKGQVCGEEKCIRIENAKATVEVTVGDRAAPNALWTAEFTDELKSAKPAGELPSAQAAAREDMPVAAPDGLTYGALGGLGLALLAGVILNIMPCVLPVIPLKVLSIVQQAKESRRRFVVLGLAFAGGVVLFFAGLAALNVVLKVVLRSAFQWGEHFQYPAFLIGMSMLMVVLAMNLFGAFTMLVPRRVAGLEAKERREGVLSAVGMGALTGILSTPCSFAILTSAFTSRAQEQSIALGSVGILMIGVGMALPYAILTAFPSLVKRLPRPGRWMELFKQSMGFVLLLVAVWLLNPLSSESYPFWVAGFGVVLAFALWMWGSWVRYDSSMRTKVIVRGLAVLLAAGAGLSMLPRPSELAVHFEPYNQLQIDATLNAGRPVLIDMTADWCLNCKTVEKWVYNDPEVAKALADAGVLAVKGDITRADMPANALRERLNEAIPVTVIYFPGTKEPVRLRGIFSKSALLDAIAKGPEKP